MKFIITFGIVSLNHNTWDLCVSFMEGIENPLQMLSIILDTSDKWHFSNWSP